MIQFTRISKSVGAVGLLLCGLLAAPGLAQTESEPSFTPLPPPSLSFYGSPGIIDMPSAEMLPDGQIVTSVSNFAGAVADDLKTATRALGFMSNGGILTATASQDITGPHAVNTQPYSQLFIRSNLGGGSAESLGVNGESDICRRIVVGSTPLNDIIYDIHTQAHDHVQINGKREFNNLYFQVVDVDGKTVDTHGLPISFSIIFEDVTLEI